MKFVFVSGKNKIQKILHSFLFILLTPYKSAQRHILIIIAVIFRTQISNYAKGYSNLADDSIAQAKGEKCQTVLGDRYCASVCKDDDQPVGDFADCDGKKCCERI